MKNNLNDIIIMIMERKKELKHTGVLQLGFFGSYVRGENLEDSDLDVVVVFKPEKKNIHTLSKVRDILESATNTSVDILTPGGINPHILPYIEKEIRYEKL